MLPKNKPLFSIIVPAYNVEQYLPECIASVLAQSCQDFELILVDDGSMDHTDKICDQYQNNSSIKVIHQSNAGLSAARNTGVQHASGEYLIFLDGDDFLEPNALATIRDNLEPRLDLLRFQAQEVFENGEVIHYPESGFATMSGPAAFQKLAQYHYLENAWLYAYRREFFLEHQFTYAPGRIAEDFGLTPLIIATAQTVKAIPDVCYNYRQRPDGIMSTTKTSRLATDTMAQVQTILPKISRLPHTEAIMHFLVASSLTIAARLSLPEFLEIYVTAKRSQLLSYIHPDNLKALPRALILKHFPRLFYHLYHH